MFKGELSFLNAMARPKSGYRQAAWLKSEYTSNEWHADFGGSGRSSWRFDVRLNDGSRLTDPRHEELLDTFKQWLCAQTHPSLARRVRLHPASSQQRVHRTLHLIDYLLLNARPLQLAEHGLQLITLNDVRAAIGTIASTADAESSVYEWPTRLGQYLLNRAALVSAGDIAEVCDDIPAIAEDFDHPDTRLTLSDSDLLRVRVWLWKADLYRRRKSAVRGNCYSPELMSIADEIYADTLFGVQRRSVPPELCFDCDERVRIEKRRVRTTDCEPDGTTARRVAGYVDQFRGLHAVCFGNGAAPLAAFAALDEDVSKTLPLKALGRYRPLPHAVVYKALRSAMEFSLTHGHELIDAFLKLKEKSAESGTDFLKFALGASFRECLSPHLLELGVQAWSLKPFGGNKRQLSAVSAPVHFGRLRQNHGLYELLQVLIGSVFVCVGALMARRSSELQDLMPGEALDASGLHLIFRNRKSGEYTSLEKEARPIPAVGANLLRMVERLHIGNLASPAERAPLITFPHIHTGRLSRSDERIYGCVDMFCDYFELDGEDDGSRYYIRQHQLRQFFAVCFFWQSGFNGLDTLRWFLGHLDPSHLWHYITQSIPGNVLRVVKVDYALEQIRRGTPEVSSLANLLFERFGTREFAVMERAVLERYVDQLLQEGSVHIEPEFLTSDCGETYRIVVRVSNGSVERPHGQAD